MEEFISDEQSRKKKTIIVASIAGAVVLAVAIWGIVSIIGSVNSRKVVAENTDEAVVAVEEKAEEKVEEPAKEEISPADNYEPQETPANQVEESNEVIEIEPLEPAAEVPNTGASDMVLTALLMGAATTLFLTNRELSKREA